LERVGGEEENEAPARKRRKLTIKNKNIEPSRGNSVLAQVFERFVLRTVEGGTSPSRRHVYRLERVDSDNDEHDLGEQE
jgi:hypothetical protein